MTRTSDTTENVYWGNATWDADIRQGRNGQTFATVGLAADDGTYYRVVGWGVAAEPVGKVRKGDRVEVIAPHGPEARLFTTRDGVEHCESQLRAFRVVRLPALSGEAARARKLGQVLGSDDPLRVSS